MKEMNTRYNPHSFENRIYKEWKDSGTFHTKIDKNKEPYTISMPPPNVTGALHMGHALGSTIQDILIRYKRMDGYAALWIPGTDHASISTEALVVEKIHSEGNSKEKLGRDGFLKEAWDWTHKYGGQIVNQLERLGVSCDWDRERFTLDEGLSYAVEEQFIRLYNDGYIYRGDRIINYCINCGTAISDAEVEHIDEDGNLWTIFYPFEDSDGGIEIATTRPETMLGDLAVAVHPEDDRYKHMIGEYVILPLVGRRIPIIADSYVDSEFGSGAVKITPSHDPNDFDIGERHDLGQCKILEEDGTISEGYAYTGMSREEARIKMVEDLKKEGYLISVEDHEHAVGHCDRCTTVIEPLISLQWFVEMKDLAKRALDVYKDGQLNIVPKRFGNTYTAWLENIRDWCISRQLWWGHRLPVYYCMNSECGEYVVSRDEPEFCPKCKGKTLNRDEDTLDTWFSSALWPFSILGWPEKTEELEYFFPNDVLVTGYDIIFFWVIRMVFSSLYSLDEIPFKDVYLTGIVRDSLGRKMSKSLNNGIDPLEIIDEYGADALRFMLVTGNSPGNDMRFHIERVEQARNFANKIWNASRFVLMHVDFDKEYEINKENFKTEDKWIISRLKKTMIEVDKHIDRYDIGMAADKIYDFTWHDFCDWYIELVKPRLFNEEEKGDTIAVLLMVLEEILKLLHPFMPFITEEIYQHLPNKEGFLMAKEFTSVEDFNVDEEAVEAMGLITDTISAIRNLRQEMNIPAQRKSELLIVMDNEANKIKINENKNHLLNMAYAIDVEFVMEYDKKLKSCLTIVLPTHKLFLPMEDLLDIDVEISRLEKEIEKLNGEIKRLEGKLANEGFINKAPEKVVNEEREKLIVYQNQRKETQISLDNLEELR